MKSNYEKSPAIGVNPKFTSLLILLINSPNFKSDYPNKSGKNKTRVGCLDRVRCDHGESHYIRKLTISISELTSAHTSSINIALLNFHCFRSGK